MRSGIVGKIGKTFFRVLDRQIQTAFGITWIVPKWGRQKGEISKIKLCLLNCFAEVAGYI